MAEDAEGSQASQVVLNPSGFQAHVAHLEILRRPPAFRASRSSAFGSLRMTALLADSLSQFVAHAQPRRFGRESREEVAVSGRDAREVIGRCYAIDTRRIDRLRLRNDC